jgi:hypothetical protein
VPRLEKELTVGLLIGLAVCPVVAQECNKPNINNLELTPKEVVEQLWNKATAGDLLTSKGWIRASQYFSTSAIPPGNQVIVVMSNTYGVVSVSVEGKSAEVQIAYYKLGELDSQLRFTPAPKPPPDVYQTSEEYHLAAIHRHIVTYTSDGKTLSDKEIPESVVWQIEGSLSGPPWTTVNTAIRYVLEQKVKATDPVVRKNSDDTLQKLLALN